MNGTLIGYARCSTDEQDLTAQRDRLRELGVYEKRIYLDHGLTGTNRKRPGLDQALAAVREGDTLVVPKLDRLARSVPDARDIGDSLAGRGIKLSLGGQLCTAPCAARVHRRRARPADDDLPSRTAPPWRPWATSPAVIPAACVTGPSLRSSGRG
jgi:hypothetical protein